MRREIPEFTMAVCDVMAPEGLSAMVLETGPGMAGFVSPSFGTSDRLARTSQLIHQYPDTLAFLNLRQENGVVADCVKWLAFFISIFGDSIRNFSDRRAGCWMKF